MTGPDPSVTPYRPEPRRSTWSKRLPLLLRGFLLGQLLWWGLERIGLAFLPVPAPYDALPWAGLAAALWMLTPWRRLLWIAAGVLIGFTFLLAYTPLIDAPVRALPETDILADGETADAVVVLSSRIHPDGGLYPVAQVRLARGLELIGRGRAPRLVITRLPEREFPSARPEVERQMQALGLHAELLEAGPVRNTRMEAVAVAALARREGWRRVIVVTDPFHSRRAAGALRREGLKVRSVPCGHGEYRSERLDSPDDRIEAFRDWLHETMAIRYYRSRGWL